MTYQTWRSRHSVVVEKFLEIAERKVSVLDDYGDERWDLLPKEIEILLLKTAKLDSDCIESIKSLLFRDLEGPDLVRGLRTKIQARFRPGEDLSAFLVLITKYRLLKARLEREFCSYHESHRSKKSAEQFDELSGREFETYVAKVLTEIGFKDVSGTPVTGDQGADLIAKRDGRTIVIQAKRYQGSVGNRAVQEVVGAVSFYGADEGWVVTSGSFTPSAKALAQKNSVKLIDGHALRNRNFS